MIPIILAALRARWVCRKATTKAVLRRLLAPFTVGQMDRSAAKLALPPTAARRFGGRVSGGWISRSRLSSITILLAVRADHDTLNDRFAGNRLGAGPAVDRFSLRRQFLGRLNRFGGSRNRLPEQVRWRSPKDCRRWRPVRDGRWCGRDRGWAFLCWFRGNCFNRFFSCNVVGSWRGIIAGRCIVSANGVRFGLGLRRSCYRVRLRGARLIGRLGCVLNGWLSVAGVDRLDVIVTDVSVEARLLRARRCNIVGPGALIAVAAAASATATAGTAWAIFAGLGFVAGLGICADVIIANYLIRGLAIDQFDFVAGAAVVVGVAGFIASTTTTAAAARFGIGDRSSFSSSLSATRSELKAVSMFTASRETGRGRSATTSCSGSMRKFAPCCLTLERT